MGLHFPADFVSRRILRVALAAWQVERLAISVGEKLVVHRATLDRIDRVRVHRLALVHRAMVDAREIHIRGRSGRFAESVVPGVFCGRNSGVSVSPGCRNMEFSVQMGLGRYGARATCRRTVWRSCRT